MRVTLPHDHVARWVKFSALIPGNHTRGYAARAKYESSRTCIVFAESSSTIEQKFVNGRDVFVSAVKRWFEGVIELLSVKRF